MAGIFLGTFTQLDKKEREDGHQPDPGSSFAASYLDRYIPSGLPVAFTDEIGHGIGSRAALIGGRICLKGREPVRYLPV